MFRPAVIVGLGGTGQWVLTMLKKELLEQEGKFNRPRDLLSNVRLVALDTHNQRESQSYNDNKQQQYEGEKRIGNIRLIPGRELIVIDGDCKPISEKIRSNELDYRHLDFFKKDFYNRDMQFRDEEWFLENGAGKFRQFSALAIYKELLEKGPYSHMFLALKKAIEDVKPEDSNSKIEIVVVSSLAGGTGSGMIIPIGILLRQMIEVIAPRQGNFRAVILLPMAFTSGAPNLDMDLRTLATLRELWRQQIPPVEPRKVTLAPTMDGYQKISYMTPYQGIYLVDSGRKHSSNDNLIEGIFPAIALWIQQLIDKDAGENYRGFVETNRKGAGVFNRQRSAEGVFGTFGVPFVIYPLLHNQANLRSQAGQRGHQLLGL